MPPKKRESMVDNSQNFTPRRSGRQKSAVQRFDPTPVPLSRRSVPAPTPYPPRRRRSIPAPTPAPSNNRRSTRHNTTRRTIAPAVQPSGDGLISQKPPSFAGIADALKLLEKYKVKLSDYECLFSEHDLPFFSMITPPKVWMVKRLNEILLDCRKANLKIYELFEGELLKMQAANQPVPNNIQRSVTFFLYNIQPIIEIHRKTVTNFEEGKLTITEQPSKFTDVSCWFVYYGLKIYRVEDQVTDFLTFSPHVLTTEMNSPYFQELEIEKSKLTKAVNDFTALVNEANMGELSKKYFEIHNPRLFFKKEKS